MPIHKFSSIACPACGWQTRTIELRADGVVQWMAKFNERGSRLGVQAKSAAMVEHFASMLLILAAALVDPSTNWWL